MDKKIHTDIIDAINRDDKYGLKNILKNVNLTKELCEKICHTYTFYAISEKKYKSFDYLAYYHFDVDSTDENGQTLLMKYISHNHKRFTISSDKDIFEILRHTKSINKSNPISLDTALHMIIDYHIALDYHINAAILFRIFPRYLGDMSEIKRIIKLLINHNADPLIKTGITSPIEIAIEHKKYDIIECILSSMRQANRKIDIYTFNLLLSSNPNIEILSSNEFVDADQILINSIFLNYITSQKYDGFIIDKLFTKFVHDDDLNCIKVLISYPTVEKCLSFLERRMIFLLVEKKYEIFDYMMTVNFPDILPNRGEMLLISVIDINDVWYDDADIFGRIIKHVKNINKEDIKGGTALYYAIIKIMIHYTHQICDHSDCFKYNIDIISLLLDNGADPTHMVGITTVITEAFKIPNNKRIMDLLLKNIPVDKNIVYEIRYAINHNDYDNLETLLSYTKNITNERYNNEILAYAQNLEEPNADIIELLVAHRV